MVEDSLPLFITIGSRRGIEAGFGYEYTLHIGTGEALYICNKGTGTAGEGEFLLLRKSEDVWTAWHARIEEDEFVCREPVFRSSGHILTHGWHEWQINKKASTPVDGDPEVNWEGETWSAEAQVRPHGPWVRP